METNEAAAEPLEVIRKNRIKDDHIKSAVMIPAGKRSTFASDIRISCSSEVHVERPDKNHVNQNKVTTREKERSSFEFQWLRVDMTVT